jgi:hypothetical protein
MCPSWSQRQERSCAVSAENVKLAIIVASVAGVLIALGVAANRRRDFPAAIAPLLWLAAFVVVGWALAVLWWA